MLAKGDQTWVIVEINRQAYALAADRMRQMIVLPEVAAIPELPEYIRGVIALRDQVIPLVDLRRRMGMASVAQEIEGFCGLMDARENDHRKWLGELRLSIQERRKFGLTTDPHQCAFGKWYDRYQAKDPWLSGLLQRFDKPHHSLHAMARQVKELQDGESHTEAESLAGGAGAKILDVMIQLFGEVRAMVRGGRRETVAVLTTAGRPFAVSVDRAIAVERLEVEDLPPVFSEMGVVTLLNRTPSPMAQRAIACMREVAASINVAADG